MSGSSSSLVPSERCPSRADPAQQGRGHGRTVAPGVVLIRRSIAVCGLLALLPAVGLSQPTGPIDRLEALGRTLRAERAWQASYHQEYVAAGMSSGEEVDGTVWVSWPDRALFRSGDPTSRYMGMDGRRVRLLDLEESTCDDHLIDDDEWARIPLAAVLDPQQALDRFTVLDLGRDALALIPREPGGVARVEVELAPDGMPAEVVVIDPQGAVNRLLFESWRSAQAPAGGSWLPEPPEDIDCEGTTR